MRLFLLRHGKTEYRSLTGKDVDRELNTTGIEDVKRLGEFLQTNYSEKSFSVYCSTAKRTRQTHSIVSTVLREEKMKYLEELYHADLVKLLEFIWLLKEKENVFIIGHNNGISDLATYLLGKRIMLPTTGFLEISFPEFKSYQEVSQNTGILENFHFTE